MEVTKLEAVRSSYSNDPFLFHFLLLLLLAPLLSFRCFLGQLCWAPPLPHSARTVGKGGKWAGVCIQSCLSDVFALDAALSALCALLAALYSLLAAFVKMLSDFRSLCCALL